MTSLTIEAPASSAASATASFEVSIETVAVPASPATTGSTRAQLLLLADLRRPGPRRFAPDVQDLRPVPSQLSPCAIAASGSRYCPPSENESGVTLTTPISFGSWTKYRSSTGSGTLERADTQNAG